MNMFQILSCSDIGTCCGNYALASFLDIGRRIINLIQLLVPILLMVACTYQLIRMVVNPELKGGMKKITNKFLAAAIIFFVPIVFDISIGIMPEDFSFAACWKTAKTVREVSKAAKLKYIPLSKKKATSMLSDPSSYEKGKASNKGGQGASGVGGQKMVNTALKELGNNDGDGTHHKYEVFSGLDDSQPWCAAFVTWVAGQSGYLDKGIFPRFTACTSQYHLFKQMGATEHLEGSGYNPVAGDIIFFGSASTKFHVGIVISSDSKNVYTIEGNTSGEGEAKSRCPDNRGCVSKRTRTRRGDIYSYMTPKYK